MANPANNPASTLATAAQDSPFHRGERQLQTALGVRDKVEKMGQRVIRDHLPEQHAEFYAGLPYVFIGSVDASGRPWASMLTGQPGFMHSSDPSRFNINAWPVAGDALRDNLATGARLGLLGIDYAPRRRNRMAAGVVSTENNSMQLDVHQTFGNCPQYIQAREYLPVESGQNDPDENLDGHHAQTFTEFDEAAQKLIAAADNFYIASYYAAADDEHVRNGADVSHRGGKPGFVRVNDERSLSIPDFSGNRHFNTLGNILLNGKAGLLFIDFDSGDALQLTGTAVIDTDCPDVARFEGAERLVHFTLESGALLRGAVPGQWNFIDYSPRLTKTGSWEALL
jgi:predicted pyridoxine 5'-phosphate oxidase superfamily flavin-nucleotide-binding protein